MTVADGENPYEDGLIGEGEASLPLAPDFGNDSYSGYEDSVDQIFAEPEDEESDDEESFDSVGFNLL
jgi:hypothetical protein